MNSSKIEGTLRGILPGKVGNILEGVRKLGKCIGESAKINKGDKFDREVTKGKLQVD